MGRCSFKHSWLSRDDGQGHTLSEWGVASGSNDFTVICNICKDQPEINVRAGFQAIQQHAKTTMHVKAASVKLNPAQLRLERVPQGTPPDEKAPSARQSVETVRLYSLRDASTRAELIWTMLGVANDASLASNAYVSDTFKAMFDCPAAHSFTMSPTKSMCLITEALGPYFKQQKNDMDGKYFSLSYDETTNKGGHKELQTYVRYWSDKKSKIVCEQLETFFIGKAKAVDIKSKFGTAMNNSSLPLSHLVMLSSDGPNVNKTVFNLIHEEKKLLCKKPLLDVGFCNLLVVHNAFKKGLAELGENISDLIFDVHRFFKNRPTRWEQFQGTLNKSLSTLHFIKHCSSRWLTLGPAAERLLKLWDPLNEYFLKFLPKQKDSKRIVESKAYKRIKSALQTTTIKAEVTFVVSVASVFEDFLRFFQKDKPLIHRIHDELHTLLKTLIGRVCKNVTPSETDM